MYTYAVAYVLARVPLARVPGPTGPGPGPHWPRPRASSARVPGPTGPSPGSHLPGSEPHPARIPVPTRGPRITLGPGIRLDPGIRVGAKIRLGRLLIYPIGIINSLITIIIIMNIPYCPFPIPSWLVPSGHSLYTHWGFGLKWIRWIKLWQQGLNSSSTCCYISHEPLQAVR